MIKRPALAVIAVACCWLLARPALAALPSSVQPSWESVVETLKSPALPLTWQDASGNSLVFYHLQFGTEADAVRLLQQARLQRVSIVDRDKLAYLSAANGKEYALKELIVSGISPSTVFSGESLLMVAAREEKLGIMRILITAGADVNYKFRAKSKPHGISDALTSALEAGKYNAMRLLLGSGYNLGGDRTAQVDELLFSAIAGGSLQAVSYILSNAKRLNMTNAEGETPLTFAIQIGASDAIVSELLLRGADPCKGNKDNKSIEELLATVNKNKAPWDTRYIGLRDRLVCRRGEMRKE